MVMQQNLTAHGEGFCKHAILTCLQANYIEKFANTGLETVPLHSLVPAASTQVFHLSTKPQEAVLENRKMVLDVDNKAA